MPRPKVNVRVSYDKAPVAKGVKCNYCSESDCYFIDIDELRDKMLVRDVFMERSFFDRNGDKYYFSNLHIKKSNNGVTIEAVFEKQGCDEFIIIDELNNVIANVETVDFEIVDNDGTFFRNHDCSKFNINWIPKRDFLKAAFMRGVYVVKDGKRRYFSRFHVDRDKKGVVSVKFDVDDNNVMIQNRG